LLVDSPAVCNVQRTAFSTLALRVAADQVIE